MRDCFQFEGMSILDHGMDVRSWYEDLKRLVSAESTTKEWHPPKWIGSPVLREALGSLDDDLVRLYQVYHDCGKPLCRTVDGEGRQHFPGHALASMRRWLECSDGSPGAVYVSELIAMDMDVHLLRADGVEEFTRRPHALVLLLTGLCELHSNAQMFGGVSSTGFKIKFKNLERFGARIVALREAEHVRT
jgi:hypothetical protein